MSERVSMPALGESVTEGTVTRWLKSVGDTVAVDEPLLEVSTDKVDTEIPSPVAGTLQEILAEEDETVEVGADLCVVGDDGDAPSSGSDDTSGSEDASAEQEEAPKQSGEDDDAQAEDDDSDEDAASTTDDAPTQGGSGGGAGETVTMPALGESVTEGTVTRWLKAEGDEVTVDEPLLEVSTDKVDTEIPSPVAGVLSQIIAGEDETVEVGGKLAIIGGEASGGSDAAPEPDKQQQKQPEPEPEPEQEPERASQEPSSKAEPESAPSTSEGGSSTGADREAGTSKADQYAGDSSAVGVGTQATQKANAAQGSNDVSAYVTPLVRKLAAQHGVDLASLEGTGVGGRIRKQDVLDAAKAAERSAAETPAAPAAEQPAAPAAAGTKAPSPGAAAKRGTTETMSRLRKVIATRMVESLQVSAQLTTVVEVDVTKVARLRSRAKDEFQRREGVKLSFMPFFAMAAIEALKEHPKVNASVEDDQVVYHAQENLGVAVDTDKGLIVPVIKESGDLNIAGLARKIADLAERTRTNKVGPDELGGGTFTLTNTGSRGALFDTPIINQPQVGILGTGSVVKRPVVVIDEDGGETIAIRSMVYLALTYDHRIVDGADAARFLETVKARLEDASFEV